MSITEEIGKFPPKIRKLFPDKLPLPSFPPSDYEYHLRKTRDISPITPLKPLLTQAAASLPQPSPSPKTKLQIDRQQKRERESKRIASYLRQLNDYHQQPVISDPSRTVFVSRLDYKVTEIDISNALGKYGDIESVKIIRDKNGKSRGYGFIVFVTETSSRSCVQELSATGLKIEGFERKILVDIQRHGAMKTWKPRRLGGGLGGRGYTKTNNYSSAASSGRRLNLNPYPTFPKSGQAFSSSSNYSAPSYQSQTSTQAYSSYSSYSSYQPMERVERSIRDKYSKYNY
ncbi:U1 small nuclear ribonucleoprotein 70 kDa homolog [[Candida] jaroonii]|uniref:U1 small nuclear ribonucleoprotein 70 kDa homolog n=1 Tax=[Candida] jaroonii TaxID=467808 RepID=A0ACA9Y8H5_9ASCO|nr:U1 small nuclear ribonucleoprotein 70 kDa homolog [[Candida] jaroonii]